MPDPHGLPSIETLLEEADRAPASYLDRADTIDLAAIEASLEAAGLAVAARAEPHDAAAWLPLPDDVDDLPSVHALLDPHPEVQAAVVAEAEAVVADALAAAEAASAPSPARAEPHDATAWLPLPSLDELPPVTDLLEDATARRPPPAGGAAPASSRRPGCSASPCWWSLTVLGGGWAVSRLPRPSGSKVTLARRRHPPRDAHRRGLGRRPPRRPQHVKLGPGDVVVPSAPSALHDGLHVDVLRSFPVTVDVDGASRTVRTVETSAEGSPSS